MALTQSGSGAARPGLVSTIRFGEQSPFGLPPLDLMDDPEASPRRRAISFPALMECRTVPGPQQRTTLFDLIMSPCRRHGFHHDDPRRDRAQARPRTPTDPRLPPSTLDWFGKTAEEESQPRRDRGLRFNKPMVQTHGAHRIGTSMAFASWEDRRARLPAPKAIHPAP